ncbi:MAG: hypothetical protein M3R07_00295 [Gemmatimonadota bacterium]|nr:hypothetical protein [Gemmatimonadota bacterium]
MTIFARITQEVLRDGTRNRLRFVTKYPREVNEVGWPRIARWVRARIGRNETDVDMWLWTQANLPTIRAVMNTLGQPMEKAQTVMRKWGYTGAACLPMALARNSLLRDGNLIVLTGSGAGLTMGCMALEW